MSELSLKISGQNFKYWNDFSLNLAYNSLGSTFSFTGLAITGDQRNLFKPLSYHAAQVYFENQLLLTGTILNTGTISGPSKSLVNLSGYSKPGVLEDCNIPLSLYPLQFDNMSVKEIAEKLAKPFGISVIVSPLVTAADEKLDSIAAEPEQTIKDLLSKLCKTKAIILSHNEAGNIILSKINNNARSVATYIEGMPSTTIKLNVNGQGIHSELTGQKQVSIGTDSAGEETISNPLVRVFRPLVKKQESGKNDDTDNSIKMVRGAELRAIQLTIETDRWVWSDGAISRPIRPNNIIEVISPENYITRKTRFFVESVEYVGSHEGIKATIKAVLPECYTGETPKITFT